MRVHNAGNNCDKFLRANHSATTAIYCTYHSQCTSGRHRWSTCRRTPGTTQPSRKSLRANTVSSGCGRLSRAFIMSVQRTYIHTYLGNQLAEHRTAQQSRQSIVEHVVCLKAMRLSNPPHMHTGGPMRQLRSDTARSRQRVMPSCHKPSAVVVQGRLQRTLSLTTYIHTFAKQQQRCMYQRYERTPTLSLPHSSATATTSSGQHPPKATDVSAVDAYNS